ncbi:hypothetical protein WA026_018557 [Henosepilachna vigintioctopunctata]|uniref:Uncharacterized protein n=1 Tax=Henosepilachna vigintioctopunctata TaxID=420089 RepID=A0AAW1U9R6_9CUCU
MTAYGDGKSESNNTVKLPQHKLNPSYTARVLCCVIFIFLTEICLAHYVYRLISAEVKNEFVAKNQFDRFFLEEILNERARNELLRLYREFEARKNIGRNVSEKLVEVRRRRRRESPDLNLLESGGTDEPHVEFFSPEMRENLETKDELRRQQNGGKGAAPGGDSWVWLTSYSRIPSILSGPVWRCQAVRLRYLLLPAGKILSAGAYGLNLNGNRKIHFRIINTLLYSTAHSFAML